MTGHTTSNGPGFSPNAAGDVGASVAGDRHGSPRQALVWGGTGFVLGAVCWHAVGFWSFMATIMFAPADRQAAADQQRPAPSRIAAPAAQRRPAGRPPQPEREDDCALLSLDRSSGGTSLSPCPKDAAEMRLVIASEKADRETPAAPLPPANAAAPPGAADDAAKAPAVADWVTRVATESAKTLAGND